MHAELEKLTWYKKVENLVHQMEDLEFVDEQQYDFMGEHLTGCCVSCEVVAVVNIARGDSASDDENCYGDCPCAVAGKPCTHINEEDPTEGIYCVNASEELKKKFPMEF